MGNLLNIFQERKFKKAYESDHMHEMNSYKLSSRDDIEGLGKNITDSS